MDINKDRTIEILIYYYFNRRDNKINGRREYWIAISNLCALYGIDQTCIVKATRILLAPENVPQEDETVYLMNQMGVSVRQLNRITGIYWQKKIEHEANFAKKILPKIEPRIKDVFIKKNLILFIQALIEFTGIFNNLSLDKLLKA
jgi:hypothetical protein